MLTLFSELFGLSRFFDVHDVPSGCFCTYGTFFVRFKPISTQHMFLVTPACFEEQSDLSSQNTMCLCDTMLKGILFLVLIVQLFFS